ncbi:hypothetical protein ACRAWF_01445 [Streptomyces sp. L7]
MAAPSAAVPGASRRLDHRLLRRLQRIVRQRPEPGRLAVRPGHRIPRRCRQLGNGRDRVGHRLHEQRVPRTGRDTWSSGRSGTAPATGPRDASRPSAPTSPPLPADSSR